MTTQEFNWTTPDGILIHGYHWDTFHPKAVLVVVHGLGEYGGRYREFARYFSQYGYAVLAYDRRGHGRSGGKRGHTPSYEAFQEEINHLLGYAREQYPASPLFLYGHSMGGNLVLYNALQYRPEVVGVVASAPWIALTNRPPVGKVIAGRLASRLFPAFTLPSGIDPRHLTHDTQAVEEYMNDPLVHDQISAATGTAMLDTGRWLSEYTGKTDLPILIMHGTDDQLTSPEASQAFTGRVKGDLTYVAWQDAYHELHHEPNKAEILEVARKWCDEHLDGSEPPAISGP